VAGLMLASVRLRRGGRLVAGDLAAVLFVGQRVVQTRR
jgi:hypothetical protein